MDAFRDGCEVLYATKKQLLDFMGTIDVTERQNFDRGQGIFKLIPDSNISAVHKAKLEELLCVLDSNIKKYILSLDGPPELFETSPVFEQFLTQDLSGEEAYGFTRKDISKDVLERFRADMTDVKSYNMETCCSRVLEESGMDGLLHHFFKKTLTSLSSVCTKNNIKALKRQGVQKKKTFEKWRTKIISSSEKGGVGVLRDFPEKPIAECCDCLDCGDEGTVHRNANCNNPLYAAGIESNQDKCFVINDFFSLSKLRTLLDSCKETISGVTSPHLYFGGPHSFFPLHIEDGSLYSINYLHYGAPKLWIVIQPASVDRLSKLLAKLRLSLGQITCSNLLLHKYIMVTINWLRKHRIPFSTVLQRPGDSVVLLPNAAHLGFNLGPNVAEAVNFATLNWIPYGIVAPRCSCIFSAHLPMRELVATFFPELIEHVLNFSTHIPKVNDVNFKHCIIKTHLFDDEENEEERQGSKLIESEDKDRNDGDDEAEHSVEETVKRRPLLMCPKIGCVAKYSGGHRTRLIQHIVKNHTENRTVLLEKVNSLYTPKNFDSTAWHKVPCPKCGKRLAGGKSNLLSHMSSRKCLPESGSCS